MNASSDSTKIELSRCIATNARFKPVNKIQAGQTNRGTHHTYTFTTQIWTISRQQMLTYYKARAYTFVCIHVCIKSVLYKKCRAEFSDLFVVFRRPSSLTPHMSTAAPYSWHPKHSSGGLYQRVTTVGVMCRPGLPYDRASPKSASFILPSPAYSKLLGLRSCIFSVSARDWGVKLEDKNNAEISADNTCLLADP